MLKELLLPIAKKVVTPILTSKVGDEVGTVRIAKRFAKQWAASAGLYDAPVGTYNTPAPAPHAHEDSARATASAASAEATRHAAAAAKLRESAAKNPIEPRGEQRELVLYTTRRHSSCKTARRILDELGVAYSEIDLSDDDAGRQRLYKETADRTFPQVYIEGKRLGGFDDLVVAREEGRLRDLLYPQGPLGNA